LCENRRLSPIVTLPLLQIHSFISQGRKNGPVTWHSSTDAAPPPPEYKYVPQNVNPLRCM